MKKSSFVAMIMGIIGVIAAVIVGIIASCVVFFNQKYSRTHNHYRPR